MKTYLRAVVLLIVSLLVVSGSLFAHHGNAAYDYDKTVSKSGVVTEWIWANPHCWLKFDATDDKGNVEHWVIEGSNPPDMAKQGWTKTTFKPGDKVDVDLMPVKNGGTIGRFRAVTVNGVKLKGGGGRFVL